ncbi:ABC transporter ATP-binding protein [soil metagenome]
MSAIEARGLTRTFPTRPPVTALRSVDLSVPDGSILAVLGPSGCGKTTLLRTLAGMERPDAGSVEIGGRTLDAHGTHLPPEKRAVGLVPQEGALFPHLDVAANVSFGLRGRPRPDRVERVRELLALVGLESMGDRRPHELSGGQQQRVALARALAPDPTVVLLDEPFSALDTGLRATLRDQVATTIRASGTTAILVTHDQVEALTMADTVAVMRDGRIVQTGSPVDVYQWPVDEWVARFLGDAVVLPGRRVSTPGMRDAVEWPLGKSVLTEGYGHHDGPEVAVFCRPEQVARIHGATGTAGVAVVATVKAVRFAGPDATVSLTIDGYEVDARWPTSELPHPGAEVHVSVAGTVLAFAPSPPA